MRIAVVAFLALVFGCSSDEDGGKNGTSSEAGGGNGGTSSEAITYHADVAPIIGRSCVGCHRSGGVGPIVLDSYGQVKTYGALVRHVTTERIMPPWLADNSGDCQTYTDANWLSDEEISTIAAWVDAGMPEGERGSIQSQVVAHDDHLEDATHVLTLPAEYTPDIIRDDDDYRCFVIDPGLTRDQYLVEYELITQNPEIVHHAIVYNPTSLEAAAEAQALDEAEDGLGYTCFGGPIVDATVAAAWAPGRNVWAYPEGTGVPLRAGMPQIVQVHYHVDDFPVPDQSQVALKLVDAVEQELLPWFYANTELALPPGQARAVARFEASPTVYHDAAGTPGYAEPMTIIGIAAHMHKLGLAERVEVARQDGSGTTCLLDVPRWDFDWQYAYFLENPVRVEPHDLLRMRCDFDTRTESEMVYWGDGTDDEMCLALMYSVFDGGKIPAPN